MKSIKRALKNLNNNLRCSKCYFKHGYFIIFWLQQKFKYAILSIWTLAFKGSLINLALISGCYI